MTRITTTTANRRMLEDITRNHRSLVQAQERLTSQRQITRPSDDPARSLNALDYRASLRRSEQFARNSSDAQNWLVSGDTALSTTSDELARARTLAIQARSGAADSNSRAAIAAELKTIRDNILAAANTTHLGRPIFAGTSAAQTAFDPSGAYNGDAGVVLRPVSPNISVPVNRTGEQVFGVSNSADPLNGNVFETLDALAAAVLTGNDASIQSGIASLDTATHRVEASQVEIGARAKQLEDVGAKAELIGLENRKALSEIEDVDVAQAMIELNAKQFSYQAALSSTAKVMQISLLDFLR